MPFWNKLDPRKIPGEIAKVAKDPKKALDVFDVACQDPTKALPGEIVKLCKDVVNVVKNPDVLLDPRQIGQRLADFPEDFFEMAVNLPNSTWDNLQQTF